MIIDINRFSYLLFVFRVKLLKNDIDVGLLNNNNKLLNIEIKKEKHVNQKKDIIDAWIALEQFSEGDIKSNDKNYKRIEFNEVPKIIMDEEGVINEGKQEDYLDWNTYFLREMEEFIKREKIKEEKQNQVGVVLYFGIFKFEEVINIIRNKYKIEDTGEELKSGEKFTLSLSFDRNMKLASEKLFFTMAGFVKQEKDIPANLIEEEDKLKSEFSKLFEEKGFNRSFYKLVQKYSVDEDNCRINFVKNIEESNVDMHSFFIEDLNFSKDIDTDNLGRYLMGFNGKRINLDGNMNSEKFNPSVFYNILQPQNYPMGRFPSNPDFSLSFMQQVAVNLYLKDKNDIMSVNGPPGTGKTTLLKDIFADLMVQQAYQMLELIKTPLKGKYKYFKEGMIGEIPKRIVKNTILVASSNNGAVQNIVIDLPKKKDIDKYFLDNLCEADYFAEVSNSEVKRIYNKESRQNEFKTSPQDTENWGMFSIEGGASKNLSKLLDKFGYMIEDLKKWDVSVQEEGDIIKEFNQLYEKVASYKKKMQDIYGDYKNLDSLKTKIEMAKEQLKLEPQKIKELEDKKSEIDEEIRNSEEIKNGYCYGIRDIENKLATNQEDLNRAERNFEVVKLQKPEDSLINKVKAFFGKSKEIEYAKRLQSENEELNRCEDEKRRLQDDKITINKRIQECDCLIKENKIKKEELEEEFEQWLSRQRQIIIEGEKELYNFKERLKCENINIINFDVSYDEVQKSNPWFNRDFRILQSKLFISSLRVRKLFLLKHISYLKAANNIFDRKNEYLSKEDGIKLIQIAWEWINIAIPIVSSTFASFGRMFKYFKENSLGSLFIDEAGQALPQASVGSIIRSKRVMAVGDPSQIKPVLTLDSNMMNLIARKYQVDERYISNSASTQSLIDATSQYGFEKDDEEWIGVPLWVHRRSNYPMFSISNKISYQNLMVQGKSGEDANGKAFWYDIKGNARDKYVDAQGIALKELIQQRLTESPELKNHIYVITPFKNVANQLIKVLESIKFVVRDEKNRVTNIGTVHTFQGKEAKIVYFVLGADKSSEGAARWAVSEPNIINVAATRAKEEFYVIGDKSLYEKLGSSVANDTISIIDEYNSGMSNVIKKDS